MAICLFFLLLVMLMPGLHGFGFDNEFWVQWANYNREQGLRNAYGSGTDYLPFHQYILWAYGKLMATPQATAERLHYLRLVTLAFEFLSLYFLYRWLDRSSRYLTILVLAIGNIAYSYNTLIWAQVDAVWTAFVFAGLYLAWRGKLRWSAVLFVMGLCTKVQAVVFLPLWCIVFVHAAARRPNNRWREAAIAILLAVIAGALLFLPFAFGRGGLSTIWDVIIRSASRFPRLTLSADNMWPWLIANAGELPDSLTLWGITYKQIGLIIFFLTSAVAMWPTFTQLSYVRSGRLIVSTDRPDRQLLWLGGALVSLLFFYCNTQMHERYAYPAGIFLIAYAFYSGRWIPLILFSIAHFLNLEVIMRWLALPNYDTLIFHPRFVSAIFFVTILWLYVLLYKRHHTLLKDKETVLNRHDGHVNA
jgi:Gpi18-like mannosyltransferase